MTSTPSPSPDHILEESVDAGGEPLALPIGVLRKPEAEKSIKPVCALTLAQYGVPIIVSTMSEDSMPGPSATLAKEIPSGLHVGFFNSTDSGAWRWFDPTNFPKRKGDPSLRSTGGP
ncbi:hypothetical protein Nepgr_009439 [Nepenthes gracilis]|uniref:Uncharacterized protein n=1 Tax=Nepenthes gracilis TaxID=150966 RepID=A0AAD3SBG5_NEPGR|nr:hypothetical protein Nepgr_009439 [Nepenthes gracilis]